MLGKFFTLNVFASGAIDAPVKEYLIVQPANAKQHTHSNPLFFIMYLLLIVVTLEINKLLVESSKDTSLRINNEQLIIMLFAAFTSQNHCSLLLSIANINWKSRSA
jgi:hypothetical protein